MCPKLASSTVLAVSSQGPLVVLGQDQGRPAAHPDPATIHGLSPGHAQHHQRNPLRTDLPAGLP